MSIVYVHDFIRSIIFCTITVVIGLTVGCTLSVDRVELVIGLVAHCGDARLVGDVIECDDVPNRKNINLNLFKTHAQPFDKVRCIYRRVVSVERIREMEIIL